jgi:predicted ArsR family transcriptional regulator
MYQQKIKRREIMEYLLATMGLSIREIAEITDINWMKVARILKK